MLKKLWLNFKLISFLFLGLFFQPVSLFAELEEFKTDNFLVQGSFSYDQLKEWGFLAEERRRDIAHELGYFYVGRWSPACLLSFSSNQRGFLKQSQAPNWSQGWSRLEIKKNSKTGQKEVSRQIWVVAKKLKKLEPLLSHEIAHQLFREFLDYPKELPLWLEEGVAIWSEKGTRSIYRRTIYKALVKNKTFPLKTFFRLSRYPADKRLFYSQSSSIIHFLIQEYGAAEFQRFSRLIRDGDSFEKALSRIYGAQLSDLSDFESTWRESVLQNKDY